MIEVLLVLNQSLINKRRVVYFGIVLQMMHPCQKTLKGVDIYSEAFRMVTDITEHILILKILIVRPIYFDKSVFLTRRNVMILIEQRYIVLVEGYKNIAEIL